MELLANLELGLATAITAQNLMYCFLGVSLGMLIGVLPGIGHFAAISILMPLTYHVPPTAALVMLAGIYYGAQYGGSICSILLNLPGTASSAVICLDGYPMAQQGRAGVAIFLTTIASFVGSVIAIIVLIAVAPPLARVALSFTSVEYFGMLLLGLVAAGTLVNGGILIGSASVIIGLILGLVGTDVNSGVMRFTFGIPQLFDGVSLIALAMALFGIIEVINNVNRGGRSHQVHSVSYRSLLPTRTDLREMVKPTLRGTAVGTGVGILPGTGGGAMAAFMAYAVEKRIARNPEKFGTGMIAGITAPEGANNAAAQSAFIPTLTLGIPGDAVMALMLGALLIHGVMPGPRVVTDNPELFWGLAVSFLIGNLMLLILNIPLIGIWVKILKIPYSLLFPAVVLLVCVGVYSVNYSHIDVLTVALFALVGYLLIVAMGFEPAPLLLGFIIAPLLEENFRRAMMIHRGDLSVFVTRPLSAVLIGLSVALVVFVIATSPTVREWRKKRAGGAA